MAAFWNSDVGKKIRQHLVGVKRELEFTAKFSPTEISDIIGTTASPDLKDEFVVVQGVADLIVLLPEEIWLVDFKTDNVSPDEIRLRRSEERRVGKECPQLCRSRWSPYH